MKMSKKKFLEMLENRIKTAEKDVKSGLYNDDYCRGYISGTLNGIIGLAYSQYIISTDEMIELSDMVSDRLKEAREADNPKIA